MLLAHSSHFAGSHLLLGEQIRRGENVEDAAFEELVVRGRLLEEGSEDIIKLLHAKVKLRVPEEVEEGLAALGGLGEGSCHMYVHVSKKPVCLSFLLSCLSPWWYSCTRPSAMARRLLDTLSLELPSFFLKPRERSRLEEFAFPIESCC